MMIYPELIFVAIVLIAGITGILSLLFGAIGPGIGLLALAYFFFQIASTDRRS
jgi:hypothetical protein